MRKLLAIICFVTFFFITSAQDVNFKALFIYNVTNFIQWPSWEEPFVIQILGDSPIYEVFQQDPSLKNKSVAGAAITIFKAKTINDLTPCQILYISPSFNLNIEEIIKTRTNDATLIITDTSTGEPFKSGSCINFYNPSPDRLKMQISKNNIEKKGLKVHKQLLMLGEIVDKN